MLDGEQHRLDDDLRASLLPWAEHAGFAVTSEDGSFIGPMNIYLHRPRLFRPYLEWLAAEQTGSSLAPPVREVVVLSVATVWDSRFVLASHLALARQAGVSEDTVRHIRGDAPGDRAPTDERVAHAATRELVENRGLGEDTYRRTVETFGEQGTIELVALAGQYLVACALLNAFAIPSPEAPAGA